MNLQQIFRRATWLLAAGLALVVGPAQAQMSYPHENVTLVTHSSPGGGTDVYLREMIKYLTPSLGTNLVVENVRGGSGAKAMAKLANSPADGSIFYGTTPTFINTSLLSKPKHTYKDLEGVVNIFLDPQIMYVRNDSKYQSLKQVVEDAKANPGKVKFGTGSPGSAERQMMEEVKSKTGVDAIIVTHDGGGDLLISVLNGTVDVGVGETQELLGQLEAGKVRLIAVATRARTNRFPDLPTAREQGVDVVLDKFRGIAGPKGQPADVIKAWETAIPKVLENADFKQWYESAGLVPTVMNHDEYNKFLGEFVEKQKAFFEKYGITKD
jgi:tripartite-type tricarboxylate transporter receptor subunit TctC